MTQIAHQEIVGFTGAKLMNASHTIDVLSHLLQNLNAQKVEAVFGGLGGGGGLTHPHPCRRIYSLSELLKLLVLTLGF